MKKSEVSIHCLLLVSDFRIGPDSPSGEHINEIHDNHKANFSTINIDFHRSNKTENSFSLFKRLPPYVPRTSHNSNNFPLLEMEVKFEILKEMQKD